MTEEDYKKQLEAIRSEADRAVAELMRTYAHESRRFSIGDKLRTVHMSVLVESIKWCRPTVGASVPYMGYYGPQLTKKGVPYKNGDRGAIFDNGNWEIEKI